MIQPRIFAHHLLENIHRFVLCKAAAQKQQLLTLKPLRQFLHKRAVTGICPVILRLSKYQPVYVVDIRANISVQLEQAMGIVLSALRQKVRLIRRNDFSKFFVEPVIYLLQHTVEIGGYHRASLKQIWKSICG